jgi:hypothetical protein
MRSKESSAAGRAQGCRSFSFRLSTRYTLRGSTLRSNLFKFAHLSRDASSTFGSQDAKLSMMNLVGNLAVKAIAI